MTNQNPELYTEDDLKAATKTGVALGELQERIRIVKLLELIDEMPGAYAENLPELIQKTAPGGLTLAEYALDKLRSDLEKAQKATQE